MSTEGKRDGLRSLDAIDARAVPLPHGTEVSTTTEILDARLTRPIPMGVIGRVVLLLPDDRVRVRLVGRGEFELRRDQVVPRNPGQLRYAISRAQTEAALSGCTILRATVGSRAWGLATVGSDHDTRGVFLWPFSWASARGQVPDVIVSADGSHTTWELGRTIEQALRADPNTLEMLYVPDCKDLDEIGGLLREHREAFVSRAIYGSFGRYALAQSKKLDKSLRLARHRGFVLDWLVADPSLGLDGVAERLASEVLGESGKQGQHDAKRYLKQLYASLHDQGLLEASSFESLAEFARTKPATLELPRELRPKNAYNLLRIVSCSVHWLRTGEPIIATSGELRDKLLAIKAGEVPLEDALAWTEAVAAELEAAKAASVLPEKPDYARANAILLAGRETAARRWLDETQGPWGSDAAPLPTQEQS